MDSFFKDVRHGARLLFKSPGVSGVSVLALTLGIGLTTTMFSIVYGALFRGLPYEESERIMHLEENNLPRGFESMEVPIHDYHDWRREQRTFDELGAFYSGTVNVSGTERAERYDGGFVSANTFRILRVTPVVGRLFQEGEDAPGATPVVLVGYELWQTRFEADPQIVGKVIRANGEPMTIVGVMPERFMFPTRQQIWLPLKLDALKLPRRTGQTLEVFGRLKAGVTEDQAKADFERIAKRITAEFPRENENVGVNIKPFTEEYIGDEPRALLLTMLGAVMFVLLIACANVANLLLGRAMLRTREVGIRTALGASRWRLVTQFLSEAMVLSIVGAIFGIAVAFVGVRLFNNAITAADAPYWIDIRVDTTALMFVLGITFIATLFSGSIPALQASRTKVTDVLKDESRGASSFRLGRISRMLVVFEMALSCGLLVAAGLTIKSVVKLRTVDLGFDTGSLFTARVGLPEVEYPDSASQTRFFEELMSRLGSVPGVKNVTLASGVPAVGGGWSNFMVEGATYERDQDIPATPMVRVMPDYFATLGVKLKDGRDFNLLDQQGSLPVAIVNESFAKKFFPDASPIGRRIRTGGLTSTNPWLSIVAVVPDAYAGELDNDVPEAFYMPFKQAPSRFMTVIARSQTADPLVLASPVRDAVTAIDNDIPTYFVQSVNDAIAQETWFYRVFGVLFMVFGFAALLLASIGLYAVMAFSVSQRTREVGIRMAIGAQGRDVLAMILRQGLMQVGLGMLFGLALAFGLSRMLSIILFDVDPQDPVIFATIVVVLTSTAMLACFVPARRATRVHPNVALRYEG